MWKVPSKVDVDIPDGKVGKWSICTVTVSKRDADFAAMRSAMHGNSRYVPEGTYKGLKRDGAWDMIMSNTPDEIRDMYSFFKEARGKVLINGLGLGVALKVILEKKNEDNKYAVDHVTVIEQSEDVIKLVGEHFIKKYPDRLNIIQADALTYKPTNKYDVVFHDIWDNICSDNLNDMKLLHRKYGKRTKWQASWCRELCEMYKRRDG